MDNLFLMQFDWLLLYQLEISMNQLNSASALLRILKMHKLITKALTVLWPALSTTGRLKKKNEFDGNLVYGAKIFNRLNGMIMKNK